MRRRGGGGVVLGIVLLLVLAAVVTRGDFKQFPTAVGVLLLACLFFWFVDNAPR